MSIIRIQRNDRERYLIVEKEVLEIPSLRWEAKGLWCYLMSRPDDWNTSVAHLIKHFPGGKEKVYHLLRELEEHGLCSREQPWITREDGKRFKGSWVTTIYETPQKKFKDTEKPIPVFPVADSTHTNEERSLKRKEKKEDSFSEAEAAEVATFLFQSISAIKEDFLPPNMKRWAVEVGRLMRIDKRKKEEVLETIKWVIQDSFWRSVILSPTALRKHYDSLQLKRTYKKAPHVPLESIKDVRGYVQSLAQKEPLKTMLKRGDAVEGHDYIDFTMVRNGEGYIKYGDREAKALIDHLLRKINVLNHSRG